MSGLLQNVGSFVRDRLELRGKMDEPTLKKYRILRGVHVRSAAEVIGIAGFIIYATFLSAEYYRHRYVSFAASSTSALCYLLLILGINANLAWAHWPYFFANPIALFVQILMMITSHFNAQPHEHNEDATDDHTMNMVSLVLFIGFVLLLHGWCMFIVYRSYEFMLDYQRKQVQLGEEMSDVIRTPHDAEEAETETLR